MTIAPNKQAVGFHPEFCFLLIFAAVLRLFHLGHQSFWADEIASVQAGQASLVSLIGWYTIDPHPPLFYSLVKMMLLGGDSEWYLRLLPALAGIGMVVGCYLLALRISGRVVAGLSTLFLAVNPMAVWMSQELRSMSLLGMFSVFSVYYFTRFLKEGNRKTGALFIIFTALMCYTHYYAFFVLAFEFLYFLCARPDKIFFKKGWIAFSLVGVSYVPWLPFFLLQFKEGQSFRAFRTVGESLRLLWFYFTTSHSPWKYETFTRKLDQLYFTDTTSFYWWAMLLLLPFLVLFVAGIISAIKKNENRQWVLVSYAVIPILLVLVASRFVYLFEPKYLAGVLPGVCILMGIGIEQFWNWKRPVAVVLGIWILVLTTIALSHLYFDPSYHRPDWRRFGNLVTEKATQDDAVLVYRESTMSDFLYYYKGQAPVISILDEESNQAPKILHPEQARIAINSLEQRRSIWFLDCLKFLHDPDGIVPEELKKALLEKERLVIRKEMGFELVRYEPLPPKDLP